MIVPRYYENLSVLHENTMPVRAYSVSYTHLDVYKRQDHPRYGVYGFFLSFEPAVWYADSGFGTFRILYPVCIYDGKGKTGGNR